jgi:hypothetical protein
MATLSFTDHQICRSLLTFARCSSNIKTDEQQNSIDAHSKIDDHSHCSQKPLKYSQAGAHIHRCGQPVSTLLRSQKVRFPLKSSGCTLKKPNQRAHSISGQRPLKFPSKIEHLPGILKMPHHRRKQRGIEISEVKHVIHQILAITRENIKEELKLSIAMRVILNDLVVVNSFASSFHFSDKC